MKQKTGTIYHVGDSVEECRFLGQFINLTMTKCYIHEVYGI